MPKAIKKKAAKKAGIKEDEVKSAAAHVLDHVKEKQRTFILAAAALGIAVTFVLIFVFYSFSIKKDAYSYETEAYSYYFNTNLEETLTGQERWEKALELFRKSIDTKSTPAAQFYLGNCYFNLKDYDSAVKEYEIFISKYGKNEQILPLVYQKLASSYFKKGENESARKVLNDLSQFKEGAFRDTALVIEARNLEDSGRDEDALIKYKELADDFPSSPWASEANARIRAREMKSESETSGLEETSLLDEGPEMVIPEAQD